MVAAVKGYRLILVMPDSMSVERRRVLAALGATVELTPREKGMPGSIARAQEIAAQQGTAWIPQQFENPAITSRSAVRALVSETCATEGRIDALVHVAAMCENTTFLDTDDELWLRTLDVCLTGTFLLNQEVARVMVEQGGGRIINFASTVALTGGRTHAAYSAAKAGVIALSKCVQRELASANVVVMIVAPGATDTPLYRQNHPDEDERNAAARRSGPPAQPEEVAEVVAFLAGSEASHLLTGQTIHTNGGRFLGF